MASSISTITSSSSPDGSPYPVDYASPISVCIRCDSSSRLMNGWRTHSGGYAQLCIHHYSVYEAGLFCETYHLAGEGWRDCKFCKKLVHCGCIVSLGNYLLDDFGGITCLECSNRPQDLDALPSVVIPLFEKLLTDRDVRLRNCRLEIPNMYAKAYFPEVSRGKVIPLHVLDLCGNEWQLSYHRWNFRKKTMYVLQGLKDFMKSKNRKAGDKVAFYRRELDKKIIIELFEPSSGTSSSLPHQA